MSLEEQFTVFPRMETKRLFLRQMMIEDAEAHFGFFSDPELQQCIRGGFIPESMEQTQGSIERFSQDFVNELAWSGE